MSLFRATKVNNFKGIISSVTTVRHRKTPLRKPTWLPVAKSKLFRIPERPYVPPDEQQLIEDLNEEYTTKMDSIRKIFQEEAKLNADNVDNIQKLKQKEEEEFGVLLAENEKENERIRVIREKTLEKEFQENLILFMQMAEEKKLEIEKRKLEVEAIVREEKEKAAKYITLENLDSVIEKAIDNPVNFCFSLGLDGSVIWEGKPSPEYELEIQKRIEKSLQS